MPRPSEVRIDRMQSADFVDVLRVDASSFPQPQLSEAQLRDELARPWSRVWVARAEAAEPLATVAFVVAWHVADELHILSVAVDPAWRRSGIARRLMETTFDYARENGARQILLEVRRSNRAATALYRTLGFYANGVRRSYYADGEDAVEMAIAFDETTGAVVTRADEIALEA